MSSLADRLERDSARAEAARQAADDAASAPRLYECADCGHEQDTGRRCGACGSYKLAELRP